jgi:hypothetical protein
MGSILGTMFLGISYLAHRLQVVPDPLERRTVLSIIADVAFGKGPWGHVMYIVLQVATMAVLVLAANTSFADFPRLANFHAGDAFMPRQLTSRGHRLVFSNGVLALGAAAGFLIVLFQANVTRLIPFYALGVFTSFTMSQAGMAKRHLRLKEPGWRHGFAINAFGALATAVVDVVIMVTKFPDDLAIIALVPILVVLLVRMNKTYEHEGTLLDEDLTPFDQSQSERPTVVLVVDDLDRQTIHALQYVKTIQARDVHAVHFSAEGSDASQLVGRWKEFGIDLTLELVTYRGELPESLAWYVANLPAATDVNVVLANPATLGSVAGLRRRRFTTQITHQLLPYDRVRVTIVRDHPGPGHQIVGREGGGKVIRFAPRATHRVVARREGTRRRCAPSTRDGARRGRHPPSTPRRPGEPGAPDPALMELCPVPLDVIEC